ncbi:MAG: iron complex transport system substrate-binding protein [Abditibacteriota bacterium]|nr:iron complex transport system substrate-binding protein [Abditibacteriota bacterium]
MRSNSSASCRSGQYRFDSTSVSVEAVSRLLMIGGLCSATLAAAAPMWAAPAAPSATIDDAKGPIVSILQPQYSDQLKGSVSVLIGVEARKFSPQSVEMFVDGVSQTNGPIALPSLPSANFSWDTARHSDGPHKLTVVVADTQGFRGSSEVTVYINNNRQRDLSPPALDWLNVKNGDTWRGMVNVELKVVDNFGVKYLFVLLNPSTDPLKKPASASWFLNRPPYTVPFDSRKLPDGLYTLRALAYDALENEGSAPTLQVGIANNSINPTTFAPLRQSSSTTVPSPLQSPLPNASRTTALDPSNEVVTAAKAQKPVSDSEPIRTDSAATTAPAATEADAPDSGLPARSNASDLIARSQRPHALQQPETSLSTSGSRDGAIASAAARPAQRAEVGGASASQSTSRQVATRPSLDPRGLPSAARSGTQGDAPGSATLSAQSTLKSQTPDAVMSEVVPGAENLLAANTRSTRGTGEPELAAMVVKRPNGSVAAHAATRHRFAVAPTRASRLMAPTAQERSGGVSAAPQAAATRVAAQGGKLAPMAPQTLTSGQTGLSAWVATGQGSVAAPVMPKMPSPNLVPNRAPLSTRASAPYIAALPELAPRNRGERGAITVTPGTGGMAVAAMPVVHVAQRDETLTAIAKRYKLPVAVLATHNKLTHNARLKMGRKVLLPQPLVVTYLGRPVTGDVASMMVGSMGVTPFRFLFEKQGGKLHWDAKTRRVTARNATHQVTLTIGREEAVVNQKDVMMDLAAFLLSGRTMVPIRFFEKALQAKVEWEPATGRLFVAMAN